MNWGWYWRLDDIFHFAVVGVTSLIGARTALLNDLRVSQHLKCIWFSVNRWSIHTIANGLSATIIFGWWRCVGYNFTIYPNKRETKDNNKQRLFSISMSSSENKTNSQIHLINKPESWWFIFGWLWWWCNVGFLIECTVCILIEWIPRCVYSWRLWKATTKLIQINTAKEVHTGRKRTYL